MLHVAEASETGCRRNHSVRDQPKLAAEHRPGAEEEDVPRAAGRSVDSQEVGTSDRLLTPDSCSALWCYKSLLLFKTHTDQQNSKEISGGMSHHVQEARAFIYDS